MPNEDSVSRPSTKGPGQPRPSDLPHKPRDSPRFASAPLTKMGADAAQADGDTDDSRRSRADEAAESPAAAPSLPASQEKLDTLSPPDNAKQASEKTGDTGKSHLELSNSGELAGNGAGLAPASTTAEHSSDPPQQPNDAAMDSTQEDNSAPPIPAPDSSAKLETVWPRSRIEEPPLTLFDDNPEPLRKLIILLYSLVTPPFAAATYMLTPEGPVRYLPATIVLALCLSGAIMGVFLRHCGPFGLTWCVGVVPVVCCGISYAASAPVGTGFMAVVAAPTSWAAVMVGGEVVAGAALSAVITVVVVVYVLFGTGAALLSGAVAGVIIPLVGWVGHGKSMRHRANLAELRASREKFTLAFEASHDGIYLSDMETGVFVEVNAAFERLSGYSREEATGHSSMSLNLWADTKDREKYFDELRAKGHVVARRLRHRRKDGSFFWGESSSMPLLLSGRRMLLTTTRDVTQQQEYEKALVEARHLAEASSRVKADFLANMSHEIRTPLNGVIGMTGLLLDTSLSDEQRRLGETVRTSAESLLSLINDVLDLSKVEAGKMELEQVDYDLESLFDEFAGAFAVRAQGKGLEFACNIAPNVPRRLFGDPGRLRQVLSNLAGNAIKFTDDGEVVVRADLVELDAVNGTTRIKFSVRDTGIGIPKDKQDGLFQKFTQVDASVTRRYGGTGLGLAICRELTKMMGGEIGLLSQAGLGSTFWFTVKVGYKPGKAIGKRRRSLAPAPGKGAKVLVVEHHKAQREGVVERLETLGLRAGSAEDIDSALEALAEAAKQGDPYRLVIAEDTPPIRSGMDLIEKMVEDGAKDGGKSLPTKDIVLVRPVTLREPTPQPANGLRVVAILSRPVSHADLFDCMSHLVGGGPAATWPPRSAREDPGAKERKAALEGKKILVVEDNPVNQQVALGILRKVGIKADTAGDGFEAIKALSEVSYDLVFMDVQMPMMDGLEATRRIRSGVALVQNKDVPIIALTAHAMRGDKEICMEAGMDDYLSKPITFDAVRKAIDRWLLGPVPGRHGTPNPGETFERRDSFGSTVTRDGSSSLTRDGSTTLTVVERESSGTVNGKTEFDGVVADKAGEAEPVKVVEGNGVVKDGEAGAGELKRGVTLVPGGSE